MSIWPWASRGTGTGRALAALSRRPHNSGPGRAGQGAWPDEDDKGPAALSPTLQLVAWPAGGQDQRVCVSVPATLGSKQTGRPLPPAALGRARIAQPGPVTSVPRLILKYALQARRARLSLQFQFSI